MSWYIFITVLSISLADSSTHSSLVPRPRVALAEGKWYNGGSRPRRND